MITTFDEIFTILDPYYCFIWYCYLENLVEAFLKYCKSLKQALASYKKELEKFKKLTPIKSLYNQISLEMSKGISNVELKLMGFGPMLPLRVLRSK